MNSYSISYALTRTKFWETVPCAFDVTPFLEAFVENGFLSTKNAWEIRLQSTDRAKLKFLINSIDSVLEEMHQSKDPAKLKGVTVGHYTQNPSESQRSSKCVTAAKALDELLGLARDYFHAASDARGNYFHDFINELEKATTFLSAEISEISRKSGFNVAKPEDLSDLNPNQHLNGGEVRDATWSSERLMQEENTTKCHNDGGLVTDVSPINTCPVCRGQSVLSGFDSLSCRRVNTDQFTGDTTCTGIAEPRFTRESCERSECNGTCTFSGKVNAVRDSESDLFGATLSRIIHPRGVSSCHNTVDYVESTERHDFLNKDDSSLKLTKSSDPCLVCGEICLTAAIMDGCVRSGMDLIKFKTCDKQATFGEFADVCGQTKHRSRPPSATKVTVTNGEIANAIANDSSQFNSCVGLLEKLRNFTSPPPKKSNEFCSCSDDDYFSDDEGSSLSSFTSISSLSSEALNCWLQDDCDIDEQFGEKLFAKNDIIFQFPAEDTEPVVPREKNDHELNGPKPMNRRNSQKPSAKLRTNEKLSLVRERNKQSQLYKPSSREEYLCLPKVSRLEKARAYKLEMANFKEPCAKEKASEMDSMWKSQKSAFWSMKHLLATTTNFVEVLPDLLKLRIFTDEQLERHDRFKQSSSITILRAVGERIDADKSAMPMFLVALRSHNSDLVDKIHQKVFAGVSRFEQNFDVKKSMPSNEIDRASSQNTDIPSIPRLSDVSCNYGNTPTSSRYSRRQFTIAPASDPDHVTNIKENNMGNRASPYFSKSAFGRSMTPTSYLFETKSRDTPDIVIDHEVTSKEAMKPQNLKKKSKMRKKFKQKSSKVDPPEVQPIKAVLTEEAPPTERNVKETEVKKTQPITADVADEAPLTAPVVNELEPKEIEPITADTVEQAPPTVPSVNEIEVKGTSVEKKFTSESIVKEAPSVVELIQPQKSELSLAKPGDSLLAEIPTSSLRRSSSCRAAPSRGLAISTKATNTQITDQSSELRRSSSFTSRQFLANATKAPEKKTAIPPGDVEQRLKLICQRFAGSSATHCDVTINHSVEPLDVQNIDVDGYVKELVTNCVISTRSAWVIRKCSKRPERVDRFLDLLIGLNYNDVADVMQRCPMTRKFVERVLDADSAAEVTEPEESNKECDVDDNLATEELEPEIEANLATTISQLRRSSIETDVTDSTSTIVSGTLSPYRDVTSFDGAASDDTDVTITPSSFSDVTNARSKCSLRGNAKSDSVGKDESHENDELDSNNTFTLARLEVKNTEETKEEGDEKKGENNFASFLGDMTREKSQPVALSTDIAGVALTNLETDHANVECGSPLIVQPPQDSDLKTEESPSIDKIAARQRSRVQLFIKNPTAKVKLQRSLRSNRNAAASQRSPGDGSYVSQILFPISTRKNSVKRKIAQENYNFEKHDEQSTSSVNSSPKIYRSAVGTGATNLASEKETEIIVSEFTVDMPPVLTLNSTKEAKVCLNNNFINKETFSSKVSFPLKPSCDQKSNDINNHKDCDNQLVTILTNGGNISPPSSFKKNKVSHRVSFSDLPPIEFELDPQDSVWLPMSGENKLSPAAGPKSPPVLPKPTLNSTAKMAESNSKNRPGTPLPSSESLKAPLFPKKSAQLECKEDEIKDDPREGGKSPPLVNKIDQINELLMDILEEIEAENISINRCLDDLVTVNLLSKELACTVSPTYEDCSEKCKESSNKDLLEQRLTDDERERSVEKLLDVLTNLGLENLLKCRNCILGRLCQLSTYQDYESAQKAAAAANGSPPLFHTFRDNDVIVDNDAINGLEDRIRHIAPGRNPSSEESEFSATESDDDIHLLRHQFGRHRRQDAALTIKEVDEDENHSSNEQAILKPSAEARHSKAIVVRRKVINIRSMLTILIDEGIVEPRQVWLILGAGNDNAQKAKLKRSLSQVDDAQMARLYEVPGLEMLRTIMEDKEIDFDPRSTPCLRSFGGSSYRSRKTESSSNVSRSSSVRTSELHGGMNPPLPDTARLMEEHTSSLRNQEQRLSSLATLSDTGSNQNGLKRSASTRPGNAKDKYSLLSSIATTSDDVTKKEQMQEQETSLDEWCRKNNLSSQSVGALRKSGYTDPAHLCDLSEDGIEELPGLSWLHKAKLWVAIENLRLNEFYKKSHSGLTDILKILET